MTRTQITTIVILAVSVIFIYCVGIFFAAQCLRAQPSQIARAAPTETSAPRTISTPTPEPTPLPTATRVI